MRSPFAALLLPLLTFGVITSALSQRRDNSGPQFVTTGTNGRFSFNGTEFPLIGTTAYWLPALNKEEDIDNTLGNISKAGFNVVRTWAFNDVTAIPVNGTWFQLINNNGTLTVNDGPNGLQKLDTVLKLAEKHKLFLMLSLTNNWNPESTDSIVDRPINFTARDMTGMINTTAQRNFLSNQYGGMDVYVRQLTAAQEHSEFYTNQSLINAFKDYTTQVVSRYVNNSNLLSWEVANDARCNSTLATSATCTTNTVTNWHSVIAQHIKSIDPNHLVSSGVSGYFCPDCPKLFQKPTPTGTPQPSTSVIARRRVPKPLSKKSIMNKKRDLLKKIRAVDIAERTPSEGGIRIRGRWLATPSKRQQSTSVGPAFDGSTGVDSEDVLSIPQIGFGSFQLFPDQYSYALSEPSGPLSANESLQVGLNWIQLQAEAAARNDKPIVLTSFGLVTQNNSQAFVPFNSTQPVLANAGQTATTSPQQQSLGLSNQQRDSTYQQWIQASLKNGLSGVIQYQWGQGGLSVQQGTPVSTPSGQTQVGNVQSSTGVSPNDGYSTQGLGSSQFIQTIKAESQAFGAAPA
jgi:mannan endo-1,4-beta-mannosidase